MTDLPPLEVLFDAAAGDEIPLPERLRFLYGRLVLPPADRRASVLVNFVQTLDGVTALGVPGKPGGGPISGGNQHDRLVMGLLRSVCDAVVVGAGTARSVPGHLWTPGYIFPTLADDFSSLRSHLGLPPEPANVIVTASGRVDPSQRVFAGDTPVIVVTTSAGAGRLPALPAAVRVLETSDPERVRASSVLDALVAGRLGVRVLLEGGPTLLGDFLAEDLVDDVFLTVSPQIAGRNGGYDRPGLVANRAFAPDRPLWTSLVSVRRAADFLFLRHAVSQPR